MGSRAWRIQQRREMENDVPRMTAITSLLGDQSRGDQLQESLPPQKKENKQQNLSQLPNGLEVLTRVSQFYMRMKSDHHIAN